MLNALHIPKPYNEDTYGVRIVDAKYIAYLCKNSYETYRKLTSADMLGIDDLGTEPSEVLDYGNVYTPVIDLLTKRYEEQLFTIITTNLTRNKSESIMVTVLPTDSMRWSRKSCSTIVLIV